MPWEFIRRLSHRDSVMVESELGKFSLSCLGDGVLSVEHSRAKVKAGDPFPGLPFEIPKIWYKLGLWCLSFT